MLVSLTDAHIAVGRRGSAYLTPLALAVAEALGPVPARSDEERTGYQPLVAVSRRLADDPAEYAALVDGKVYRLNRRCQVFARVWDYGPCGGTRFAVRGSNGKLIREMTYCEVIAPFLFTLPLGGDSPLPLGRGLLEDTSP